MQENHILKIVTTFGISAHINEPPNPHGELMHDVWRIPTINNMAKERVGYPTQKPIVLLERIVKVSSNPEDIILNPFCGCATACVAADALDRHWIGIDVSERAAQLVRQRIDDLTRQVVHRTDIPKRTDIGGFRSTVRSTTVRLSTAIRAETAVDVALTSSLVTFRSTTSLRERREALTTFPIFSFCAVPATASRETGEWNT